MSRPKEIQALLIREVGREYWVPRYGLMKVIDYYNHKEVLVEFAETGSRRIAQMGEIKRCSVKDLCKPNVYGVGFLGGGVYRASETLRGSTKCYYVWRSMLQRCYDPLYQAKRPTYVGCSVISEWHNYQAFANWFYINYPHDGLKYHLDKDILREGNRVYGPDTCMFVSPDRNAEHAHALRHKFIFRGEVCEIYNLSKFCKERGFSAGNMWKVAKGDKKSAYGYTKYES